MATRLLSETELKAMLASMDIDVNDLSGVGQLTDSLNARLKSAEDLKAIIAAAKGNPMTSEQLEDDAPSAGGTAGAAAAAPAAATSGGTNSGSSSSGGRGSNFDPRQLPAWPMSAELKEPFSQPNTMSIMETLMFQRGSPFFELRLTLQDLTGHVQTALRANSKKGFRAIVQDPAMTVSLLMSVHNARLAPSPERRGDEFVSALSANKSPGVPVLEVHYAMMTQDHLHALMAASPGRNPPELAIVSEWLRAGCITVKAESTEEVLLMKQVLELNSATLSPAYCKKSLKAGQAVHGPMMGKFIASFLLPLRPLNCEERDSRNINCLMCNSRASKSCSRCGKAKYCSQECQKAHWSVHKPNCNAIKVEPTSNAAASKCSAAAAADRTGGSSSSSGAAANAGSPSVLVDMVADAGGGITSLLNWKSSSHHMVSNSSDSVPSNVHGAKQFIVKIQAPMAQGPMPLMMYDQKRSFSVFIGPQQAAYGPLLSIIRSKGWNGLKAYFWAQREGEEAVLRVATGTLPSQAVTW